MTVKKVPEGYATIHCHGKKKGERIHTFKTKKEALAQHAAIEISEHRKQKHHSAPDGEFLSSRKAKFGVE